MIVNFFVFVACREFRKRAEFSGKIEIPEGYFEVKKRKNHLKIISADSIPQNKLIKRLDYVIHSYSIDSLNIIQGRPMLKNRNITKF